MVPWASPNPQSKRHSALLVQLFLHRWPQSVPVLYNGHTAVTCAKTAEPVEMPFGLWARTSPRNHELYRVQNSRFPMTRGSFGEKGHPLYSIGTSAVSCAETAELIDLPFGLWTCVCRKKHKFSCTRQVAPMCPHEKAHWRHLANTIESSVCGRGVVLCQIALTTC